MINKFTFALTLALPLLAISPVHSQDQTAAQATKILADRCVECHGPDKQKGKLRLDSRDAALHAIKPGQVDESELFIRISLPADDVDIMPPKGDPLTPEQVAIIQKWIASGAEWAEPSSETSDPEPETAQGDVQSILTKLSPQELELLRNWIQEGGKLPETAATKPAAAEIALQEFPESDEEKQAVASLQSAGALAMKVSQDGNWLRVNCRLVGDQIGDTEISPLSAMKNLIELDLSRTQVTDAGLAHISGLSNLTHLNLNNTGITDEGLKHLASLNNLTYLNLYGTKVSDTGLDHLKGLKTLEKLYIWQTDISDKGSAALQEALPAVEIIGGWKLESVQVPEAKPAEEAKAEEKQAVAPEKPEPPTVATGPTLAEILLTF